MAEPAPGISKEILVYILDDDPDDLEAAREGLLACRAPNRVRTFDRGAALMEAIEDDDSEAAELPELIVLDIHLPEMSGLDVLRRIREMSKLDDCPIIMLSSTRSEEEISEAFSLGCNALVDKNEMDIDLTECLDSLEQYWICPAPSDIRGKILG